MFIPFLQQSKKPIMSIQRFTPRQGYLRMKYNYVDPLKLSKRRKKFILIEPIDIFLHKL